MSVLDLIHRRNPVSLEDSLETNLDKMLVYGRPRLSYFTSGTAGWCCSIEMNTTGIAGVQFEVRSEFGMQTPNLAAVQCLSRAMDAVARAAGMAK